MHGDKLTLTSGHQFGDRQPVLFENSRNLIGIGLALSTAVEIEEPTV